VLSKVADVVNREGRCDLTQEDIARLAKCSRTTVSETLALARKLGHIEVAKGVITINFDAWMRVERAATAPEKHPLRPPIAKGSGYR
jgi:predicted transcriptional regulator